MLETGSIAESMQNWQDGHIPNYKLLGRGRQGGNGKVVQGREKRTGGRQMRRGERIAERKGEGKGKERQEKRRDERSRTEE